MTIAIKLNTAEHIRRAREANPDLSQEELATGLGVTVSQVKAALAYRRPGQKRGRNPVPATKQYPDSRSRRGLRGAQIDRAPARQAAGAYVRSMGDCLHALSERKKVDEVPQKRCRARPWPLAGSGPATAGISVALRHAVAVGADRMFVGGAIFLSKLSSWTARAIRRGKVCMRTRRSNQS